MRGDWSSSALERLLLRLRLSKRASARYLNHAPWMPHGLRRPRSPLEGIFVLCGIYGVVQFDASSAQEATLESMAQRTVHRGPDDQGAYVDGPVAIGIRRLSIIDVAGGHQP